MLENIFQNLTEWWKRPKQDDTRPEDIKNENERKPTKITVDHVYSAVAGLRLLRGT